MRTPTAVAGRTSTDSAFFVQVAGRHPNFPNGLQRLASRQKLPGSVQKYVAVKERERGYDEATFVESFVILNAAGGECVDDFAHLRSDVGLAELVGHELPSPEAARKFLNAFHVFRSLGR
jgi:hypothetical protein